MQHLVTLTTTTKHIPEDIRQRDCRPSARRTGYLGSQTCLRWVFWWLKSLQSPFFGGAMGIYNFYFLVQRELSKGVDVSVFLFRLCNPDSFSFDDPLSFRQEFASLSRR